MKKNSLILGMPDQIALSHHIAEILNLPFCEYHMRYFPDGETYLRFQSDLGHKELIIVDSLDYPNPKILPLIFLAETARAQGASRVGLCAPYLAYMRQDKQFHPGESVTSTHFAALISHYFDWLVTIDPHLHRRHNLDEIYSIPSCTLHASSLMADYIRSSVKQPLILGPDSESEQWAADLAKQLDAPYLILEKTRLGDREVKVSAAALGDYPTHTVVLIDDIISTGQTMVEALKYLKSHYQNPVFCIAVHGVFAEEAYPLLKQAGADAIVTSNSIRHESNAIDVSSLLIEGIRSLGS